MQLPQHHGRGRRGSWVMVPTMGVATEAVGSWSLKYIISNANNNIVFVWYAQSLLPQIFWQTWSLI